MDICDVYPHVCVCGFLVLRRPIRSGISGDASDSEEELAAFCPTVSALHAQRLGALVQCGTSITV